MALSVTRRPFVRVMWGCIVAGMRSLWLGMLQRRHSKQFFNLHSLAHTPQMLVHSASFDVACRKDLKVVFHSVSEAMLRYSMVLLAVLVARLRASITLWPAWVAALIRAVHEHLLL